MNFRILETFLFESAESLVQHQFHFLFFLMFCPFVRDFGTKDEVWNFKEELATPLLVGAPREDPREERASFREN